MDEKLVVFVEDSIRSYLTLHPEIADTLQGIHSWWIRWPNLTESPVVTQIALERLAAMGEIESFKVGDQILWRRVRG